jgi:DNA-binding transcriptional ArsR family regulator
LSIHSDERRYRDRKSFPIPVWNGIFDHADRIGESIWEFLWLLDAITKERDGVGLVLGGIPVKIERIARDLNGRDRETVRRHLKKLEQAGYIRTRRTPYGQIIEVFNSKKFGIWKREKPQITVSPDQGKHSGEGGKLIDVHEKPQKAVCNKDSAVTLQRDPTAADAVDSGSLGEGFDSLASGNVGCGDSLRHPPSEVGFQKPDDERSTSILKISGKEKDKQDLDLRYSERVDQLREKSLRKFMGQGYDRLFLNLALDEIDERAWAGGKRIGSIAYFETSLENFLADPQAVERMKHLRQMGKCSPADVELVDPRLSSNSEQKRQLFNLRILARNKSLRDGSSDIPKIDFSHWLSEYDSELTANERASKLYVRHRRFAPEAGNRLEE